MVEDEAGMRSVAWWWRPLGSKLGQLQLAEGQLTFAYPDGEVIFDTPVDQVKVEGWPSYGIAPNSQVKLRIGGKKYRVSFVMPTNSREAGPGLPTDWAVPGSSTLGRGLRAVRTYAAGEETGAKWRELLGGE